jgi:REP element-mobilizing transposase RayT
MTLPQDEFRAILNELPTATPRDRMKKPTPLRQLSLHHTLPVGSKARAKITRALEPRRSHGGAPSIGHRKTERPFSPKAPLHVVLRSNRAKGNWSMLHRKHRGKITAMIYIYAARFKVHVYRAANVGNHLHLLVRAEEKKHLADFLRVLAGRVAVTVSGARKHVKKIGRFWDYLCWSRLVNWGRDFFNTRSYVVANELEEWSKKHREVYRRANQWMANEHGAHLWNTRWNAPE